MRIRQFIDRREWLLAAIALATIVLQVYFDLKVPEYMQEITKRIVTPGTRMQDVLGEGALMLASALGSMVAMYWPMFATMHAMVALSPSTTASRATKNFNMRSLAP